MAAAQRAAMARASAESRLAKMLAQADSDAARLARADEARERGDILVANRLYIRLARSHPANDSTMAAKERLSQLATEARQKLHDIDAALAQKEDSVSPGELLARGVEPDAVRPTPEREAQIVAAFQRYDRLADEYHEVPSVAGELKKHAAEQRHRGEFAAVLNEPEARALWEVAQEHEAKDHPCCAYWVYLQAARLVPARSARLAKQRSAEMAQEPELIASAKACREMQECHKLYSRAARVVEVNPVRAKELFTQILARAPADSEVYRAAERHLKDMQ